MSQENKKLCPVCGSGATGEAKLSPYRCDSCGFGNAYVNRFAGKRSYELWQNQVKSAGMKRFQKIQQNCERGNIFYLCENGIAYISPEERSCDLVTSDYGVTNYEEKTTQYSASENHAVRLLQNGTVSAVGENDHHQCDVKQLEEICFVLAAPRCTYAIDKNGQVRACGAPVDSAVRNWSNMKALACGSYHIAGLTREGRVITEGLAEPIGRQIASWKNVVSIAASGDCTIALHSDGHVSFAGRVGDARADVAKWENIAAIAVDSIYAVGLTREGKVMLAGKSQKDFLDMGRKNAAQWTNVVAISCSRSGIGALCQDGTVKLAGNIQGIGEIQAQWQQRASNVQEQLRRGAVL